MAIFRTDERVAERMDVRPEEFFGRLRTLGSITPRGRIELSCHVPPRCEADCLRCGHFAAWERGPGVDQVTVRCFSSCDDRVSDWMTTGPLLTVGPSTPVGDAEFRAASAHLRHLVVVRDGHLLGVACRCDLFGAAPDGKIAERMTSRVYFGTPRTTVAEAAYALATFHIGCLPVLEEGRLSGMVTRGDLRRIGVPESYLGGGTCSSCGSLRGVLFDAQRRAELCLTCLGAEPPIDPDEVQGGD